jgi:pimeloyl-ACP methyl ester carboxylesterase
LIDMPFAQNGGVRIHWDEQGSGTPIVLVMGHRYTAAMWHPVLPALAAQHRVIWFDNRGTGESDTTRKVTIADLVNDALAVMDAAGVARAHIFGVSMGGGIVLELAIRHPERVTSLILGCTCILTADKPRMPAFLRVLYYLPPGLLKLLFSSRRGNNGYGSAAKPDAIAADEAVLAKEKSTVRGVAAQAAAIANYTNTKEAVAALRMPALVLHGDEDALVPFAWGIELFETLPGSRFVRFEGAGHNFLVAAPEMSRSVVLDFVRDVDNAAQKTPSQNARQ